MITCTASVAIRRTPQAVGAYVSQVGHLPSWTTFFRSVGASADGRRYPVQTVMGPIETWIEESPADGGGTVCTINSLIGEGQEQAVLRLLPAADGEGTAVEFTVRLPSGAPPERRAGQQAAMEGELARLKELLEGTD